MLESLKSLWARWKVQVTVVGGALVVATAYGTCSYDPQTVSEADVAPAAETTNSTTVEVSATTTGGTEDGTTEGTEATGTDGTETEEVTNTSSE
jgi:FlaG/FlaF family flagellin (archaellin)